jgi:hypothetical protein
VLFVAQAFQPVQVTFVAQAFPPVLPGRKEYQGRNTDQGDEGNFAASRASKALSRGARIYQRDEGPAFDFLMADG